MRVLMMGATCQPVSFGQNIGGLEVEVHPVLDRFAFGHPVNHQDGLEPTVGVCGY